MTGKFKHLLMVCVLYSVCVHAGGQERSEGGAGWVAGGMLHRGVLLNHHDYMKVLNEKSPYAVELYVARATFGERGWQTFYRNPLYGVSYMMFDLGSPSYLGRANGVYPFMSFFLTGADRAVSLNMRIGAGVAHVEKIFDDVTNYENRAISTHFNALLCLRMEGRLRVAAPLYLSGGVAFTHMSNGSFRKPNAGLNYATAYAGASYAFGRKRQTETAAVYDTDRKWHYAVYLSGGVKTYDISDATQYIASGVSLQAFRSHLAFTAYSGALELFYDTSDYAYLTAKERNVSRTGTVKAAVAAGYSFVFGRLSTSVQLGGYVYAMNQRHGPLYQRLALNYSVTDRLNVRIGLKTHWGQADYVEISSGYRLR